MAVGCRSVRPSVPSIDSSSDVQLVWFAAYRLSIDVCRLPQPGCGQQMSIDSCQCKSCGQRQCCDPRRIDADLFGMTLAICYKFVLILAENKTSILDYRCICGWLVSYLRDAGARWRVRWACARVLTRGLYWRDWLAAEQCTNY